MSDNIERSEFKLTEHDELFLDKLQEISERLGWEPRQTLKACFALGWDQLIKIEKEHIDDKTELE